AELLEQPPEARVPETLYQFHQHAVARRLGHRKMESAIALEWNVAGSRFGLHRLQRLFDRRDVLARCKLRCLRRHLTLDQRPPASMRARARLTRGAPIAVRVPGRSPFGLARTPPPEPPRLSPRPPTPSAINAPRPEGRLTRSCEAGSRSAGRRSPAGNSPPAI